MNRRHGATREQGFVLVGVVMFVLALGILSLSLFSLSSYEAGFFQRSLDDERARQRAAGGVELVKSLVAMEPDQLERVKLAEGRLGIEYANAWQVVGATLDSTGSIDLSKYVHFRVRTRAGGIARTVEGAYLAQSRENPYKRLITSNGLIFYNTVGGSPATNRVGTTILERPVWQTVTQASDTLWKNSVVWTDGPPLLTESAPVPDVPGFMAAKFASAVTPTWIDATGNTRTLRFDAGPSAGATRYFRSPGMAAEALADAQMSTSFDFFDNANTYTELQVRGTCIWLVPAGVRFDGKLRITRYGSSGSDHDLVIVAGPNGRLIQGPENYTDVGIWCFNGLDIDPDEGSSQDKRVRVWLVTDGQLRLEHFGLAANAASDARGLNLFADGVFLMGPRLGSGEELHMRYRLTGDARVDFMSGGGHLPGYGGAAGISFTLVAGSWRES